jgi:hypothetical protein
VQPDHEAPHHHEEDAIPYNVLFLLLGMSFDSLDYRTLSYNGIKVERPIVTHSLREAG